MVDIKTDADPVGDIVKDDGIENFIQVMTATWDALHPKLAWWKFWRSPSFVAVTTFLLQALDDLIAYVDGTISSGVDRKATVLNAIERLYDRVVVNIMPFWLRPFAPLIKKAILRGIISPAIDWIVTKYKNGTWYKKDPAEVVAQWVELKAQLFGVPGDHRPKI